MSFKIHKYVLSIKNKKITNQARKIVELFEDSWTHGLNPQSYHLKELHRLMGKKTRNALYFFIKFIFIVELTRLDFFLPLLSS